MVIENHRRWVDVMTPTSPQLGRPAGSSGEETRQRIITAAMRCVGKAGYSRVTIREIARAAEMTSGSLYHYFPNKAALLRATVDAIDEIALPRLRAAAESSAKVVGRLEAVLDESDRLMREYPYLAAFERAMRADKATKPRGRDGQRSGLTPLRDIIGGIVGDAQRQGALAAGVDARGATDVIYALTRGLTEQATNLSPGAHRATLRSGKQLIRGTLL